MIANLAACIGGFSSLDESSEPVQDALPAFGVVARRGGTAREALVPNLHQRSGAGALWTIGMQAMHALGLKFPSDDGLQGVAPMGPSMHEQTWGIDLQILTFYAKTFAVGADALA